MATKSWLKSLKLNEATVSTLLGALVVVVVGVLIFNYFNKLGKDSLAPEEIEETVERVAEEIKEGEETPSKTLGGLPRKHTVVLGENLWKIAEKYYNSGYNWVDIATENNLTNADHVEEGQELNIPAVGPRLLAKLPEISTGGSSEKVNVVPEKYTVQKGDCLWNIAVKIYGDGFRWVEIARLNNLVNPDIIHSGNVFVLSK